jgi:hypothetical protein
MTAASVRKTACILFLSLSSCYLALAPCTTDGRGYVPEDRLAALGFLTSFNAWVKGRTVPPITWTRHGPVPLLFDIPFVKLGKLFVSPDFVLSLQPVLLTAGLLTILYLWLRKLSTPGMSLLLTLIAAFSTTLWPYAYIGLETKQSFFLLLAAYLGITNAKARSWPSVLWFSTISALAVSVKANGVVLVPAIAYLVYVRFRGEWASRWKQALTAVVVITGIWVLSVIGWRFFWDPRGGAAQNLGLWMTDSPLRFFSNAIGILGSPNKGLFIFAPVLLLVLYAIPRAFREQREITVFALLVTVCTVGFLSSLVITADELWGPRFLHVTIAPLLLVIGAAWPRFAWRAHAPLIALGVAGFVISFLGAFYYYGERGAAAAAADQSVLEWLAGDSVWNEVLFDARLFQVWFKGGDDPVSWTPTHIWAWTAPPDAKPWKTINLRDYADPQSFLLYYWGTQLSGSDVVIFRICWISAALGPLLLLWVVGRTFNISAARIVNAAPVLTLRRRNFRGGL